MDPDSNLRRTWPRRLATLLIVLQALAGLPILHPLPAAHAQDLQPKVWVGPLRAENVPGAGLVSEKFDEAARDDLRKNRKVALVGETASATTVTAGQTDPRVVEAENLRNAGKAALAAGKHEEAHKQLTAALERYEAAIASVNKVEAVSDTLLYLGAVSVALDFEGDAKDYFKALLAMNIEAQPAPEFDEKTDKIFEKVKKKLARKKKGTLKIKTTPPGAKVRVDGADWGTSPVTVRDLTRGYHYVQASHDDAGLAAIKVRVKGKKTKTIDLELKKEVGPPPAKKMDPAIAAQLSKMAAEGQLGEVFRDQAEVAAAETGAEYIVVGNIAPQGNNFVVRAYIYGVDQKQVAALDELRFRADLASVFVQAVQFAAAVEAAANSFPQDKVIVGGMTVASTPAPPDTPPEPAPEPREPVPEPIVSAHGDTLHPLPPPEEEDEAPLYKKWWVWTIAGAVVIGGSVYGGIVLLEDPEAPDTFNAKVRW